ncbi:MAG: helix-turn-helix transcriptional regulator [Kiritimatiellia bacterium]
MITIQTATTPATFTESVAGEEKEVSPPEALKKICKEQGWSVQDLADHLGVSKRTVEGWMQGRRKVPLTAILLLACLLRRRQSSN